MLRLLLDASNDSLVIPSRYAIIAVVFFILGFIAGNLTARRFDLQGNIRIHVAVIITLIWAASIIGAILVDGYTTSVFIHGIMGSVVGYLFGVENPLKN